MADSTTRSDSVNVEHIMQQIRARIREKRGVDYTEQQIRDLAAEAFERFLDPTRARPGLLEAYRQGRVPPAENFAFEDTTLFESHRAPLRWVRSLFRPVLKLFFNPNPLIHVLHLQSGINERNAESARTTYELLYHLVLETTRLTVEVQTLKMRVESASARLDFAERRSRPPQRVPEAQPVPHGRQRGGLQRPPHGQPPQAPPAQPPAAGAVPTAQPDQSGPPQSGRDAEQPGGGEGRRRKRRRRGRRGGSGRGPGEGAPESTGSDSPPAVGSEPVSPEADVHDEPPNREADATPPPDDREDQ